MVFMQRIQHISSAFDVDLTIGRCYTGIHGAAGRAAVRGEENDTEQEETLCLE